MTEKADGRPQRESDHQKDHHSASSVSDLLDRSNERDLYLRRILKAERDGYRRGYTNGIVKGRQLEAAERETAWRHNSGMIVAAVWPDSKRGKDVIDAIVRGAETLTRRVAAEHWKDFHDLARKTKPEQRTAQQDAAVKDGAS
jgi:hypothetical protein